ncbi:MAG: aminoacyl-tRNA hydrolase [Candidatus Adiutrix sp.]
MHLIFGLGNPGSKDLKTRHNAGFMALECLANRENFDAPVKFGHSQISKGRILNHKVILAWPQTFMNLSGEAVLELAAFYKVSGENILVLHDDMDLAPGRLKISWGGGAAGHNGLSSIMSLLPHDFCRLKIGIGRPPKEIFTQGYADYVLANFTETQLPHMTEAYALAASAATLWVSEGLTRTQGQINRKPAIERLCEKDSANEKTN